MQLPERQFKQVADTLLASYDQRTFNQMLQMRLGTRLEVITDSTDFHQQVRQVVEWADQRGLLGALLDATTADSGKTPGAVYALLTAIDATGDRSKGAHLSLLADSAADLAKAIEALGLPRRTIRTLFNRQAGRDALLAALRDLAAAAQAGDVLLFYFAGNSVEVGRTDTDEPLTTMLITAGALDGSRPGVTHDDLIEALADCPAHVVLLLDSSHAGSGVLVRRLPAHMTVLAACRENEQAFVAADGGRGLLAEVLLEALPAAYAAQQTWRDLYDQVAVAAIERQLRTGPVQTPQLIGDGDACLLRPERRPVARPYLPLVTPAVEADAQSDERLPAAVDWAWVSASPALGLAAGAQVAVYPPASACSGAPLFTAQVTDASGDPAAAGLLRIDLPAGTSVEPGSRAVVTAAARDPAWQTLRHMLDLRNPAAPAIGLVTLAALDEAGAATASAAAGRSLLLELRAQGEEPLHVSLWAINALGAVQQLFPANTDCYCLHPGAPLRLPAALDLAQADARQERVRLKLIATADPHDLASLRTAGPGSNVESLFGENRQEAGDSSSGYGAVYESAAPPREVLPGAGVKAKLWTPGRTLRVHFLDGDPSFHSRVLAIAQEWSRYANIHFTTGSAEEAEVRVTSGQGGGSWSYIGADCLAVPRSEPTMSLGWLTPTTSEAEVRRIVLHEFGHVLGLIHEHQNPNADIPWDADKVYAYYGGPPNNWSRQQVDEVLLKRYDPALMAVPKPFDPQSIMLFPVARQLTVGGYEVGVNGELSELDKQSAAQLYPYAQAAA